MITPSLEARRAAAPPRRPARFPRIRRKLLIALVAAVVAVLACELGFRLLGPALGVDRGELRGVRDYVCEGRISEFASTAYTVYRRPTDMPGINSLGFADEEWVVAREPGVPRILCLGGSTTEGRYPFLLEQILEKHTGRDFEVLNAGISGWTSAEVLVAWFLSLQDFAPDLVILHLAVNDVHARRARDFRGDYTHWRQPLRTPEFSAWKRLLVRWSDLYAWTQTRAKRPNVLHVTTNRAFELDPLVHENRLDAATAAPFRRNVASVGESAAGLGADVALMTMPLSPAPDQSTILRYGAAENDRILRELAEEHDWMLVDAAAVFAENPELVEGEFLDMMHLSSQGNFYKAQLVADRLLADWVPGLDLEQQSR